MRKQLTVYTVTLSEGLNSFSEDVRVVDMVSQDDFSGVVTLLDGSLIEVDKILIKGSRSAYIAVEGGSSSNNDILRRAVKCRDCVNRRSDNLGECKFNERVIFKELRSFLTRELISRLRYIDEEGGCPANPNNIKKQ